MQLELEIGASPGSLSRIENGQTNPTKETILAISYVLELDKKEIGYIFNTEEEYDAVQLVDAKYIFDEEKVVQIKYKELIGHLEKDFNAIGTALVRVNEDGNKIRLVSVSRSIFSTYAIPFLNSENAFRSLELNAIHSSTKLAVTNSDLVYLDDPVSFMVPPLTNRAAALISKVIGLKSMAAIPVQRKGKVLGLFVLGFKSISNKETRNKLNNLTKIFKEASDDIVELFEHTVI